MSRSTLLLQPPRSTESCRLRGGINSRPTTPPTSNLQPASRRRLPPAMKPFESRRSVKVWRYSRMLRPDCCSGPIK